MTNRSTSSATNWRHEPKGPGCAEHVYVTLTDGRRAELLAWDIPAHSPGLPWLDGTPDLDRDCLARLDLRYTSRTNAADTSRS
jgi:hypothetical protein